MNSTNCNLTFHGASHEQVRKILVGLQCMRQNKQKKKKKHVRTMWKGEGEIRVTIFIIPYIYQMS